MSVLSKVRYFNKNNTLYKEKFGRNFKYIIISNNISQTYNDLKLLGPSSFSSNNISIMDVRNLDKTKDLYLNLLTLDNFGSVYKIASIDHSRRDFYYSLNSIEKIKQKVGRVREKK